MLDGRVHMSMHPQWANCTGQQAGNGLHLPLIAGSCLDGLPAWSTPLVDAPVGANMPQPLRMHLCGHMVLSKHILALESWHRGTSGGPVSSSMAYTGRDGGRMRLCSHAGRALPYLEHAVINQQLYAQRLHCA